LARIIARTDEIKNGEIQLKTGARIKRYDNTLAVDSGF
jgi:hypothetical protein